MKIIRSNAWGRGIHSPFVYALVTRVIFAEKRSAMRKPAEMSAISPKEWKSLKMIARLIDFFHPEKIILVGGKPRFSTMLSHFIPGKVIHHYIADDNLPFSFTSELVIWQEVPLHWPPIPDFADHTVWIKPDLKSRNERILFEYLRNYEKVSVTLEVKQTGIALLDKSLQKENFVIRRCILC